jgi:hypothetical protein
MNKPLRFVILTGFIGSMIWLSCKKEPKWNLEKTVPYVKTGQASEIKGESIIASGEVLHNAGLDILKLGFCLSKHQDSLSLDKATLIEMNSSNPSTLKNLTGLYKCPINDLQENTTYYLRAFASNKVGTNYGEVINFKTLKLAQVITDTVVSIGTKTAICSGKVLNDWGYVVNERGICYGTDSLPRIDKDFNMSAGNGLGVFSCQISPSNPQTKYFFRAYAINEAGIAYGKCKSFSTLNYSSPKLITNSPYNISTNSASCGGTISDDGGSFVTARGICYSTTPNPTTSNAINSSGTGTGTFNTNMSGLLAGKTYYVRAYAINAYGTAYGNEVSFTTTATIPTITTSAITNLTDVSCTSGGTIIQDGGYAISQKGVCWSTAINPTINDNRTINGSGNPTFVSNVPSLSASTTYYLRAYATNSLGTGYGSQMTFTTLGLPTLTTTNISNITASQANSGGTISNDGGASIIAKGICWSTSTNPTISNSKTIDGTGSSTYSSTLIGLSANTNYYVRAYATNSVGTAYGNQISFKSGAAPPTVSTNSVTSSNQTSFTAGGNATSDGGSTISAKGICWSTSTAPTVSNSKTSDGSGIGSFTSIALGLSPNTKYYYRAYATNSAGTSYGIESSITTNSLTIPSITTIAPNSISYNSASSGGNTISDGGSSITAKGVCWNTTGSPTIANSKTTDGTGTANFTSNLTGLSTGITYYVRAYATNAIGTAYGSSYLFTPNLGTPTLNSPINNALISSYFYLNWSCVPGATSYDLQISTSSIFSGTTYSLPISPGGWLRTAGVMSGTQSATCSSSSVTSNMMQTTTTSGAGTYYFYWRVRARTSTVIGSWSSLGTFKFIK